MLLRTDSIVDTSAKYLNDGIQKEDYAPMKLFMLSTKILKSTSRTILNNLNKEAATPCDGISETDDNFEGGLNSAALQDKRMSSRKQSIGDTVLESFQKSLSLEMQSLSEHRRDTCIKQVKPS